MVDATQDDGSKAERGRGEAAPRRMNPFLRALLSALFIVIWNIVEFLLIAIAVIQVFAQLLLGQPLGWLARCGGSMALWAREIVAFLSGFSDRPAFPFARWPRASRED